MKKNYFWIILFFVLVIIPVVTNAARLYTDWLFFTNAGYVGVFITLLKTKIVLGFAFGCAFFAFMTLNIVLADRLSRIGFIKIGPNAIELPGTETLGKSIKFVMFAAAAFLALVMGIEASGRWDMLLQYANPTSFGITEPVFGRDVSFYIFTLPLLNYLYRWTFIALGFGLVASICVYAYKRGFIITNRGVELKKTLYSHLSALLAAMFALKAVGYKLFSYNMLASSRGYVAGAGFTDLHIRLPLIALLVGVSALCAIIILANTFVKGWKLPAAAVALFIAAATVGAGYPEIIQKLRVNPNEVSMEQPYIKRQIEYTRKAYDIDRIKLKPHIASLDLSPEDIKNNNLTIENVRLWDPRPLLQTYKQIQEIRTYYGFNGVDVDRYMIDGKLRQVMLSAREMSYDKLPAKTWINEHLSFTHGYGACMSPVNRFTAEGMPEFFMKDIPTISAEGLEIKHPRVYYGELANDYAFVNTKAEELDYPIGESNKSTTYSDQGGIKIDSLFRKAALAIRFSSLALLLNTDITNESRILFYRNIISRASAIAPMVHFDTDPYMTISEGRMKWIIDGFTISGNYPYSKQFGDSNIATFNYIRNSVKVVIDATDGSTTFYLFDKKDPIINTYQKIFPSLFKPKEEMPAELKGHMRYPSDLFKVQAQIFMSYHMTDPYVFYNQEDLWEYPHEMFYQTEQVIEPYYTIMKLPDGKNEEFILMLPFTPSKRANMAAWMCARNDGENYGQIIAYTFPKKKLIFGPMQIEARIDQDPEISKQFSLWSQGGSQIIRGNTLVIPIEKSFLYVEPIYLKAEKGEIPELKRVIASIGNKVAMAETLELAIAQLIGTQPETKDTKNNATSAGTLESTSIADQIRASLGHLRNAKEKLKQLDWKGFGEELDALEKTLGGIDLRKEAKETGSSEKGPK